VLDAVVDTAVSFLREYGRGAFDLEGRDAGSVHDVAEMWASHLLIGTRHPDDISGQAPYPLENRDWGGARRFFAAQRQEEQRRATRALNELRGIVWEFVQGFNRALADEHAADDRLDDHVRQLERALRAGRTEDLHSAAAAVMGSLTEVLERRRVRQQERLASLQARMEALGEQLHLARQESLIDPLTHLYNRRAFDEVLPRVVEINRILPQSASLLLIDADRFKEINDEHGHLAGDAVLAALADGLQRSFPSRRDFVARIGGDEFAVVLRDTPAAEAWHLAERALRNARGTEVAHGGAALRLTVSCGVAELAAGASAADWLRAADDALYRAKERGRDTIEAAN
jgi:diguanylate cyclase (GGDEF)-like protein